MVVYTWKKLVLLFILHPREFLKFWGLPRAYGSLDEWLRVDTEKCDIIARVIGCKDSASLKKQQGKNMQYRESITGSYVEWTKKHSLQAEHKKKIDDIASAYEMSRLCHRVYSGEGAGVHCYCKKDLPTKEGKQYEA